MPSNLRPLKVCQSDRPTCYATGDQPQIYNAYLMHHAHKLQYVAVILSRAYLCAVYGTSIALAVYESKFIAIRVPSVPENGE
jgi:hypothetical protein